MRKLRLSIVITVNPLIYRILLLAGAVSLCLWPAVTPAQQRSETARAILAGDLPLTVGVLHQYPLPSSTEVSPLTEIGIRAIGTFSGDALSSLRISVIGFHSGSHAVTPRRTRDGSMIILHPAEPFDYHETVSVSFTGKLEPGGNLNNEFSFVTMVEPIGHIDRSTSEELPRPLLRSARPLQTEEDAISNLIIVKDSSPVTGEMTIDNYGGVGAVPVNPMLLSLDEHGTVLRSLPIGISALFFAKLRNGKYAYWTENPGRFIILDSATWNPIDTLGAPPGDSTDGHDLLVFANGSYALLGVHVVTQDMSSRGGSATAKVGWSTIEVFDSDKNLVMRWDGHDYFGPGDIEKHIPLKPAPGQAIDAQHSNSLDFDANGDIILSSRHLCEITKIKGTTGEVLWHLGGARNNFTLVGDSVWFSYQHDARWLPNGHMLLFDNSDYDTVIGRSPKIVHSSRAVEYILDTTAKTAQLVWQFQHNPPIYSFAMGTAERLLPSGNTLIGWGAVPLAPFMVSTEVTPSNAIVFEMRDSTADYNYRVQKYPSAGTGISGGSGFGGVGILQRGVTQSGDNGTLALAIEENSVGEPRSLQFSIARAERVSIQLFDALGRQVRVVYSAREAEAGSHSAGLNLVDVPSGAYFCVLQTPSGALSRLLNHLR